MESSKSAVREAKRLDFSALEAYVMVCQEGKMSRAAEKLFVSKQALSVIIKRMEREMDAELLVRTGTGVKMTLVGERFYAYAQQILTQWKACCADLKLMKACMRTKLRVGFAYMAWNFFTQEMGEAFERDCPETELAVEGGLSHDLLSKLDDGQLDMVVTCMQSERHAQYDRETLHTMDVWITMTAEDALACKSVLTPENLAGRKLLYPDSGAAFLAQFCQFLEGLGIGVQSGLMPAGNFLRHLRTVREEGALKLGNSLYNTMVPSVDGFVSRPLVYHGPAEMPKVSLYALMPAGRQRSMAAQRFIAFLTKKMEEAQLAPR